MSSFGFGPALATGLLSVSLAAVTTAVLRTLDGSASQSRGVFFGGWGSVCVCVFNLLNRFRPLQPKR